MMQAYRVTMMQAYRAARGGVGTTLPRRGGRRLEALLAVAAILVILAVMAMMTRGAVSPATSGAGGADLEAGADMAVVHDDAGNMPTGAGGGVGRPDAGSVA